MNGNCHMMFGVTVGAVTALNIEKVNEILPNITATEETKALIILGCIFGSILPDIDNYNSHTGKLFYPIPQTIDFVLKLDGKDRFKHRGFTHSVLLLAALTLSIYNYIPCLMGVAIGCITHLFLDAFNPQGIPILSTLTTAKIKFANIKSGSTASVVLTVVLMLITIYFGVVIKG